MEFRVLEQLVNLLGIWSLFMATSSRYRITLANAEEEKTTNVPSSFYDLKATDISGKEVDFSQFEGKVVVVVNVACECGFTRKNYQELQPLYEKYKDQGLEILAFPCNQFGEQEPDPEPEIEAFVKKYYHVTFRMFSKIDVNGPNTHPVYQFLKAKLPGKVKWNFEKFVVDRSGTPVQRFGSRISPSRVEQELLVDLLSKPTKQ